MTAVVTLPWERWPEADRALWSALVKQGGPLDDAGALSHLRATTLGSLQKRYGRWLAWLGASRPEALVEPPERRATVERLQAWRDSLARLAPASRFMFLSGPIRVLRAAAPDADWTAQLKLRRMAQRIADRDFGFRKDGRVLSTAALLKAALDLAGPQADAAPSALEAATRRRDGTMIATLALLPMRRRAFTELELGTSVLVTQDRIHIVLSEEMTKNGRCWEATVPEVLDPLLRRYVEEVRSYFLSRGAERHDVLWVGGRGRPLQAGYVTKRVLRITERLTSVRVPPHFFRDAAATTLARRSPRDARLIRALLGHSSFGVAERHYIRACTIEAGRDYASVLAGLKDEVG